MSSPIKPGTAECPWQSAEALWNTYPRNKPQVGKVYQVTTGYHKFLAVFEGNGWRGILNHEIIGWQEVKIDIAKANQKINKN